MLNNVYLKTLRDMRRSMFWWVAGMFVFTLWFVTIFPSIQESNVDFQAYIDSFPESFRAMFGIDQVDFTTLEGYLSMELFSMFYPVLVLAFAVSYGAGLLGGEEESGTLELLLATPTPRWHVMLSKFAALVTFTVIVLLAMARHPCRRRGRGHRRCGRGKSVRGRVQHGPAGVVLRGAGYMLT